MENKEPSTEAIPVFEQMCSEYRHAKLAKRLSEHEFDLCVEFIEDNHHLPHLDFDQAVNRMFINQTKPKNWTIIMDLLSCFNTRHKGNL